jgi:hypothetical protein
MIGVSEKGRKKHLQKHELVTNETRDSDVDDGLMRMREKRYSINDSSNNMSVAEAIAKGSSLISSCVPRNLNASSSFLTLTNGPADIHIASPSSPASSSASSSTTTMLTPGSKLMPDRLPLESTADFASPSSVFSAAAAAAAGYHLMRHPFPVFPPVSHPPDSNFSYSSALFHRFMAHATSRLTSGSPAHYVNPSPWKSTAPSAFTPLTRRVTESAADAAVSGLIWNPLIPGTRSLSQSASISLSPAAAVTERDVKRKAEQMSHQPIAFGQMLQQQHDMRYGTGSYNNGSNNNNNSSDGSGGNSSRSWQIAGSLILSHLRSLSMNHT